MSDIPILFSAPMVHAMLECRKTMTRRPAWRAPKPVDPSGAITTDLVSAPTRWQSVKPGDRLWVRETWQYAPKKYCICPQGSEPQPCDDWQKGTGCRSDRDAVIFRADGMKASHWRPGIHMPRWASRITWIVTAVRIERLRDISEADARAEGVDDDCLEPLRRERFYGMKPWPEFYRPLFALFIDQIHGDGFWANNPEVVVITGEVHARNIDAVKESG